MGGRKFENELVPGYIVRGLGYIKSLAKSVGNILSIVISTIPVRSKIIAAITNGGNGGWVHDRNGAKPLAELSTLW